MNPESQDPSNHQWNALDCPFCKASFRVNQEDLKPIDHYAFSCLSCKRIFWAILNRKDQVDVYTFKPYPPSSALENSSAEQNEQSSLIQKGLNQYNVNSQSRNQLEDQTGSELNLAQRLASEQESSVVPKEKQLSDLGGCELATNLSESKSNDHHLLVTEKNISDSFKNQTQPSQQVFAKQENVCLSADGSVFLNSNREVQLDRGDGYLCDSKNQQNTSMQNTPPAIHKSFSSFNKKNKNQVFYRRQKELPMWIHALLLITLIFLVSLLWIG